MTIFLLETNIHNAILKQNHLVAVFIDMEKAYDKTWRYGILKDLLNLDFRGNLPIYKKLFKSKTFLTAHWVYSVGFLFPGRGCARRQCGALFLLKINSILNQLPNTVHENLYVDDLNIFCQGKDMRYNERQLQLQ